MKVPLCLAVILTATVSVNAWAQHRGGRAMPHGGGGVHPGAMQPGRGVSPQQQQHMMQQQMMQQRMLYEIMGWTTPSRASGRSNSGGGRAQPNHNPSQSKSSRNNATANQRPAANSQRPAGAQQPRSNAAKPKTDTRAHETKKTQNTKNAARHKDEQRKALANTRLPLAADQATIGLLRTAHTKLREADHDYAGHRVRAMEHISAALGHLHPTAQLSSMFTPGSGSLPQSQSDQILRDSIVKLRIAENSLSSGTNRAAHHQNAHTSVAEAIRELNIALNIR